MPLPDCTCLCPPLASAAQMRELDRRSIEEIGIPGAVLMENAGRATVDAMEHHFGPVHGKNVGIVAGPGNNGGDGLVIARWVHSRGGHPLVLLCADPEQLPPDATLNWAIVQRLGLPCWVAEPAATTRPISSFGLFSPVEAWEKELRTRPLHSLVDALFGIGLARPVAGMYLEAVRNINRLSRCHACPVVAADIPSGLNSDTGQILGEAVQADLVVAYGLAKPGHLHNGVIQNGRLAVVDIGIPKAVLSEASLPGMLLNHSIAGHLAQRSADSHKGINGHVLLLAGSTGKTGAAMLAAQGALRSGTGLLTCAVPANLFPIFAGGPLVEAMYAPLPASTDYISHGDFGLITELCQDKQVLVIGPGMATAAATAELVLALYRERPEPMVLDADALNILAERKEVLAKPGGPRLFTPHPGEMARLLEQPTRRIQADRLAAAQQLCRLCGQGEHGAAHPIVVILKGAGTVVAAADGRWAVNTSGNPGMATGGMGDVLAGMAGGMLAQGHAPWQAACAGAYLHGAAADLVAATQPYGYSASEVAAALPQLLQHKTTRNKEQIC
ncbi:MAG: NAD(P)H-hydrate dehydratase [Desulfobulbaceae bacterium]|nr:NAD(P)H-hydrate dehydratase [Desulfobulbaceae bacterium]